MNVGYHPESVTAPMNYTEYKHIFNADNLNVPLLYSSLKGVMS